MGNFLTILGIIAGAAFAFFGYFTVAHKDDLAVKSLYAGLGFSACAMGLYLVHLVLKGPGVLRSSPLWKGLKDRRIPKAKRNTLGIAIAVAAETEEQMPQITHDFIDNLKAHAGRGALAKAVSVIVVPSGPSKKLVDEHSLRRMLVKTECTLLIIVFARIRRSKGEVYHVLDLGSAVKHHRVEDRVRDVLVQEMVELLAHRRHISTANDLEEFEWNAASVHLAALYIMAAAAVLSEKSEVALLLLDELRKQLAEIRGGQPPMVRRTLQALKARLPVNLAIAHLHASLELHALWRKTRNVRLMDDVAEHLEAAGKYFPDMPDVWNGWALYHVVKNRDMGAARKELKKFKAARTKHHLWRFNMGFTYAYEGNMSQATLLYRTACRMDPPVQILHEIEEFIVWMLEEEPGKVQLYFILGLINQHGKEDQEAAAKHYRAFLSSTAEGQFEEQRELARGYLEEPS
jgi:tetratricopeptide (TPR) repeat protein